MGLFGFGVLQLFLLLLVELTSCSTSFNNTTNLIQGYFKTEPCSHSAMHTILRVIPAKTEESSSTKQCAFACHRNPLCKYAIFYAGNNSCEQVYGLSNTFRSIPSEYLIDDFDATNPQCKVLMMVESQTWKNLEPKQLMMLKNRDHFCELKVLLVGQKYYRVFQVSQFSARDTGEFSIATSHKTLSIILAGKKDTTFSAPYRNHIFFAYGDVTDIVYLHMHADLKTGEVFTKPFKKPPEIYFPQRHLKLESDIVLANNFEELVAALLDGYRRLERHHSRTYIDSIERNVYFDTSETFHFDPFDGLPQEPYYLASIKESVADGTRYWFKHQIFTEDTLPYEEAKTNSFPWVMEKSWNEIIGENIHTKIQELGNALSQGKPIRIVLDSKISTDIIAASVTPNNIRVAMAPYMHPFKGKEFGRSAYKEIHFQIFEAADDMLVTCRSETVTGGKDLSLIDSPNIDGKANWFVSTKTWTKLFEKEKDGNVSFGSFESLNLSVFRGESIRVCVEISSELLYCLHAAFIASKRTMDEIVFQSFPFLLDFDTFNGEPIRCGKQIVLMISSLGFLEMIEFNIGSEDKTLGIVRNVKMSWFAQTDYVE